MSRKKNLFLPIFVFAVYQFFSHHSSLYAQNTTYQPISPQILDQHIDEFFNAGADGYLVWQYSGDLSGKYFANDKYSFFQDEKGGEICQVLKDKAQGYPDRFIGVNMWDIADANYSDQDINKHFQYLRKNCGVTVVRIFAKARSPENLQRILNLAQNNNLKLIIAIGDYSNGGGGIPQAAPAEWYQTGYRGQYKDFVNQVVQAVAHHSALYGLELANEPHCGGQPESTIQDYKNWGQDIASILQQATDHVGYGQMANPNGVCDSPQQGYKTVNDLSSITMASAHYYNEDEKASALLALQQAKELGKIFYIGEAGWETVIEDVLGVAPGTPRDPSEYFTYPLIFNASQSLNNTGDLTDQLIKNMVIDQGYEVQCASIPLRIAKWAEGHFKRYFELYDGPEKMSGSSDYSTKLGEAKIPLYRGNEHEMLSTKISSFEAFFGVLDQEAIITQEEIDSIDHGTATSLLSPEQQCQIKINNLLTAKQLCETLADPSTCKLHQVIPQTNHLYLYSQNPQECLLNQIEQSYHIQDLKNEDHKYQVCQQIIADPQTEDQKLIQNAINNLSLNLDRVYRLAFLVFSPAQDTDDKPISHEGCGGGLSGDTFWFLHKLDTAQGTPCTDHRNDPLDAPFFLAFKIPDFSTNRSQTLDLFQDSGQLSANSLLNPDQIDNFEEIKMEKRNNLLGQIQEMQAIRKTTAQNYTSADRQKLVIDCMGMPMCEGAHGHGVELNLALVDIINGSKNSCDDFNNTDNPRPMDSVEQAGDIYTPADFDNPEDDVQRKHQEIYYNLKGEYQVDNSSPFDWAILVDESFQKGEPDWDKLTEAEKEEKYGVKVGIHLVAPIGVNLEQLDLALRSFFFKEDYEDLISTNQIIDVEGKPPGVAKYFPIQDAKFGFNSSDQKKFYDPAKDCPCEINVGGVCLVRKAFCENSSFEVKLSDHNTGLYILGANFGFTFRKIQEGLHDFGSSIHTYISSCQRVEDLLLGRCNVQANASYTLQEGSTIQGNWDENTRQSKCRLAPNNSPCAVDNKILRKYFPGDEEAKKASIICNAESGGNSNTINNGCTTGQSVDYSIGLFQINLLPSDRCPGAFTAFTWDPPSCTIQDQTALDACANDFQNPENNIKKAAEISNGGKNWNAWSTAKAEYCNIEETWKNF